MKNEIQRSMMFIMIATLITVYATTTFLIYRQTTKVVEDELGQEAEYMKTAIELSGGIYLEKMDEVQENTRVTLVSKDGDVLYDSRQDDVTFENHKNRPEIRQAIESGKGKDIRKSDSLNQEMIYYAVRLSDCTILRVAKSVNSIWYIAMGIFPAMGIIAIVMFFVAYLLCKMQVEKLIHPINTLDLENPLQNQIYSELTPLLTRIDEQNRQKDAIADMRKEFSANVSHELKTPLTSISGYAEIMKSGLVKPEDMPAFSERIYNEASRLITLVEDIIKLSRLDEGAVELEKEEVDLYYLTREIVSRLALPAKSRNVQIELTGESVMYKGIRQILDEMVYNICENAVKYNREGGKVVIWVGGTLKGPKIIVKDTGIGIPKEDKERIFERFYRVDKSHSKETGGTGLGLSIVKHGALLHNIDVHVESELGKGTKMELIF
ncbi:MAG: ATP-binding protein [Lachnospiraceae bacterium]